MKRPLCTVLAPFDEAGDARFEVLKRIGENLGYRTFRVEAHYSSGFIIEEFVRGIRDADLLIADLTGANANVFYETGIAHALGKRVFLVSKDPDSPMTGFSGSPVYAFEASEEGVKKLGEVLKTYVQIPGCVSPIALFTGGSSVTGQPLAMRRFAAFLLDLVLLASLGTPLIFLPSFVLDPLSGYAAAIIVSIFIGYFFGFTMLLGASPGQRLLSLRIIRLDRRRPSAWQSLMRPVASALNVLSLGVSLFWMAKPGRYQSVHDTLTRTLVVKNDAPGVEAMRDGRGSGVAGRRAGLPQEPA